MNKLKKVSGDKYNISFFNSENFNLLNTEINIFDLIVFDNSKNSLAKFVDVFKQTKSYTFNIPMIILEDKVSQEFSLHKYSNAYAIFNKDNDESFLLNNIEYTFEKVNTSSTGALWLPAGTSIKKGNTVTGKYATDRISLIEFNVVPL